MSIIGKVYTVQGLGELNDTIDRCASEVFSELGVSRHETVMTTPEHYMRDLKRFIHEVDHVTFVICDDTSLSEEIVHLIGHTCVCGAKTYLIRTSDIINNKDIGLVNEYKKHPAAQKVLIFFDPNCSKEGAEELYNALRDTFYLI